MLTRNDGFFLAELLLSLNTWIIISLFMLPVVIGVREQSVLLQLEMTAVHLLYDELESHIDEGGIVSNKNVFLNGTNFLISWSSGTSQKEVCVQYEDFHGSLHSKCKISE